MKTMVTSPLKFPASAWSSVWFGSWSLQELRQMNPGGYRNPFTLHFPDNARSLTGLNLEGAAPSLKSARMIVEGDQHANTRKLLELLFLADLVDGVDAQKAKRLFEILKASEEASPATPDGLEMMNSLSRNFTKALAGLKWADDNRSLLLVGDIVSDRGADDRTTMALISQLNQGNSQRIRTLVGNHDLNIAYPENTILPGQAKSSVPGDMADKPALRKQYNAFLMNSNFFDYLPEHNAFCAHAPVTAEQLDALFLLLKQRGKLPAGLEKQTQVTRATMGQFVDGVNRFYKETLQQHVVLEAPTDQTREAMKLFGELVWGRSDLDTREEFPFRHIAGLKLIHGHDEASREASLYSRDRKQRSQATADPPISWSHSVVNLDNRYLKSPSATEMVRPLFIIP